MRYELPLLIAFTFLASCSTNPANPSDQNQFCYYLYSNERNSSNELYDEAIEIIMKDYGEGDLSSENSISIEKAHNQLMVAALIGHPAAIRYGCNMGLEDMAPSDFQSDGKLLCSAIYKMKPDDGVFLHEEIKSMVVEFSQYEGNKAKIDNVASNVCIVN
ncbi:hypothetical protein [Ketobacter alkanivorans]|uniref:Uncharacterized protein n=1 Tax=Ketobacter alkanivorans TaxID=1917421 RepID=A0A2K9LQC2_9GAMM|nr:hypothetical protein [Ketobacter alkanivorans]AUM13024.1 hypothetical protein Kalk_11580 [Ketobacter alkanivorans]